MVEKLDDYKFTYEIKLLSALLFIILKKIIKKIIILIIF